MGWIAIGRRGGLTMATLAAVAAGLVLIGVAVAAQRSAPQPHPAGSPEAGRSATQPTPGSTGSSSPSTSRRRTPRGEQPLRASRPVSIRIPAIGVRSKVQPIGLAKDGTLAVPQPGPHLNQAAWFENSPTPGQPGPSIVEGHVDSDQGPSVFFELGKLKPGNRIHVTRADGTRVTFTVSGVRDFKKSEFPTKLVYGGENLGRPQLRLITCSDFDPSIRHHVGNEVVFAHLTAIRRKH